MSLLCLNKHIEMLSIYKHNIKHHREIVEQYDICCHCLTRLLVSSTPINIKHDILLKFFKCVNELSQNDKNPLIYLSHDIEFFKGSIAVIFDFYKLSHNGFNLYAPTYDIGVEMIRVLIQLFNDEDMEYLKTIRSLIVEFIAECIGDNYRDQIYIKYIIDFNIMLIIKIPIFSKSFINSKNFLAILKLLLKHYFDNYIYLSELYKIISFTCILLEYEHDDYLLLSNIIQDIMSNMLKSINRDYKSELVINVLSLMLFLYKRGIFWEIFQSNNMFLDVIKIMQNFIISKRNDEGTKIYILRIISELCQQNNISNYLLYTTGICEWLIESIRVNSIKVATLSLVCLRNNFICCKNFKLHANYANAIFIKLLHMYIIKFDEIHNSGDLIEDYWRFIKILIGVTTFSMLSYPEYNTNLFESVYSIIDYLANFKGSNTDFILDQSIYYHQVVIVWLGFVFSKICYSISESDASFNEEVFDKQYFFLNYIYSLQIERCCVRRLLFEIYVEGINLMVSNIIIKKVNDVSRIIKVLEMIDKSCLAYQGIYNTTDISDRTSDNMLVFKIISQSLLIENYCEAMSADYETVEIFNILDEIRNRFSTVDPIRIIENEKITNVLLISHSLLFAIKPLLSNFSYETHNSINTIIALIISPRHPLNENIIKLFDFLHILNAISIVFPQIKTYFKGITTYIFRDDFINSDEYTGVDKSKTMLLSALSLEVNIIQIDGNEVLDKVGKIFEKTTLETWKWLLEDKCYLKLKRKKICAFIDKLILNDQLDEYFNAEKTLSTLSKSEQSNLNKSDCVYGYRGLTLSDYIKIVMRCIKYQSNLYNFEDRIGFSSMDLYTLLSWMADGVTTKVQLPDIFILLSDTISFSMNSKDVLRLNSFYFIAILLKSIHLFFIDQLDKLQLLLELDKILLIIYTLDSDNRAVIDAKGYMAKLFPHVLIDFTNSELPALCKLLKNKHILTWQSEMLYNRKYASINPSLISVLMLIRISDDYDVFGNKNNANQHFRMLFQENTIKKYYGAMDKLTLSWTRWNRHFVDNSIVNNALDVLLAMVESKNLDLHIDGLDEFILHISSIIMKNSTLGNIQTVEVGIVLLTRFIALYASTCPNLCALNCNYIIEIICNYHIKREYDNMKWVMLYTKEINLAICISKFIEQIMIMKELWFTVNLYILEEYQESLFKFLNPNT